MGSVADMHKFNNYTAERPPQLNLNMVDAVVCRCSCTTRAMVTARVTTPTWTRAVAQTSSRSPLSPDLPALRSPDEVEEETPKVGSSSESYPSSSSSASPFLRHPIPLSYSYPYLNNETDSNHPFDSDAVGEPINDDPDARSYTHTETQVMQEPTSFRFPWEEIHWGQLLGGWDPSRHHRFENMPWELVEPGSSPLSWSMYDNYDPGSREESMSSSRVPSPSVWSGRASFYIAHTGSSFLELTEPRRGTVS